MRLKQKAQISIEILLIIGILIIGSIIFATFYFSKIDKSTNDASSLADSNNSFSKWMSSDEDTTIVNSGICNNGVIEYPEQCEGLDLGVYTGKDCFDLGLGVGSLSCSADCMILTDDCSEALNGICGDGIKNQAIEECDGLDFGGLSCSTFGFNLGTLSCNNCKIDLSACSNFVVTPAVLIDCLDSEKAYGTYGVSTKNEDITLVYDNGDKNKVVAPDICIDNINYAEYFCSDDFLGIDYLKDVCQGNKICKDGVCIEKIITTYPVIYCLDELDFGKVLFKSSKTLSLVISNKGNTPLIISSIASEKNEFTLLEEITELTISEGKSASISIKFTPTNNNPITSILSITSNDPETPIKSVLLVGN